MASGGTRFYEGSDRAIHAPKEAGEKDHWDTNLTFKYVTDRKSEFLRMIDEKFPALDFVN